VETRQLGNSDFQITTIGFGAWAIGGGNWEFGWGPQDDQESIAAIHRALDLGINWIDTAAAYGLGHSEEVVARALKGMSNRPYVFTKCSIVWGKERLTSHSLKAESLRREVEDSLRRLQVDVIDLYQIHWPDPDPDIEEGWRTLADLKAQGKVRYIGVSNFSVEQMERIAPIAPITSLQPPYSLLDRKIEPDILPYCKAHNIGVIVYSPMASGLLSGAMTRERIANFPQDDWRRNSDWFKEPQLTRNLELVEVLRRIGQRYGVTPGAVAIAWTLRHPAVTAAIVGARRPGQVVDVVPAADLKLSQDDVTEIEQFISAKV
jgi:aryl-alcohol dehydrogenase-like predicted oxidoreductase